MKGKKKRNENKRREAGKERLKMYKMLVTALEDVARIKNISRKQLEKLNIKTWEKIKHIWLKKPNNILAYMVRVPFDYWQPYRRQVLKAWMYSEDFMLSEAEIRITRNEFYEFSLNEQARILERCIEMGSLKTSIKYRVENLKILDFSFTQAEFLDLLPVFEFIKQEKDSSFIKCLSSYYLFLSLLGSDVISKNIFSPQSFSLTEDGIEKIRALSKKDKEVVLYALQFCYFRPSSSNFLKTILGLDK